MFGGGALGSVVYMLYNLPILGMRYGIYPVHEKVREGIFYDYGIMPACRIRWVICALPLEGNFTARYSLTIVLPWEQHYT